MQLTQKERTQELFQEHAWKEEKSSTHWPQNSDHSCMQSSSVLEIKANVLPCLAADIFIATGDHIMASTATGVGKEVRTHHSCHV